MSAVTVPESPAIAGLAWRGFAGPSDYPHMVSVIAASKRADGIERSDSVEAMAGNHEHLTNCDPATDMVFAEVDGEVVGYSRVTWWQELEGPRRYMAFGFIRPQYRRQRLGTALLRWNEARIREIASDHPADLQKFFQVIGSDTEPAAAALYGEEGYEPYMYEADMVRPTLEEIPEARLFPGLSLRVPTAGQMRRVFDADREAFRDHPGASEDHETFRQWLARPHWDPTLWRVAWDGVKVAGQVRSFIDEGENREYQRRRGYTEFISVRKSWRRQGVARALLCSSLRAVEERGMEEAALGVMTDNPRGALQLYESVGFEVVKRWTSFQKPLQP